MDSETIKTKIDEQFENISKIAKPFGWNLRSTGKSFLVEMRHRRKLEKTFLLKVSLEDYPLRAPSYVFVNKDSDQPGNWPPNVQHGSSPPGICTPGTRECIEHYHKNDALYEWDPHKYPVRFVLMEIQKLMERGIGG